MQTENKGRKFKIDIYETDLASPDEVKISWGAYGSVPIEQAETFRDALDAAIQVAKEAKEAKEAK